MSALLEVDNLRTHFATAAGALKAVDGVSFSIDRGEVMGLVGESGSGKSVTGYSIMGLVPQPGYVAAGKILFNGEDLASVPAERMRSLRGARIAMIFQDPMMTLNPLLSIGTQMVETVLAHRQVSLAQARKRACETLEMVGIASPHERLAAFPHQLSGGMRQRVVIAIAMLHEPDLVIADEPTTALDVTIQAQILAQVRRLRQEHGTAVLWITHDLSVVAGLADRICVMYAGTIVEQGTVDALLDQPAHPYTRGLIASLPSRNRPGHRIQQIPGMMPSPFALPEGCRFQPRCVSADASCQAPPQLVVIKPRHSVRCVHPVGIANDAGATGSEVPRHEPALDASVARLPRAVADPTEVAKPLIAMDKVVKRFVTRLDWAERLFRRLGASLTEQNVSAVDRVDLQVWPGEVLGLVGESGCGKSTLGRMLAGIHAPSGGLVSYKGADVAQLDADARREYQLRCQMVFQDPFGSLNPRLRVGELIGEGPRVHGLWLSESFTERLEATMRRVGLDPGMRTRFPHQFSGGQRQRIGIARALAVEPDLLVCDEPVSALDVSIQAQVLNLFMELRADLGLTYVFISHDLGVIRHLADRVMVMYLGRIVESGPCKELFERPNHPYTQALLEQIPRLDLRRQEYAMIAGEIPSALDPPSGCHFHTRCPKASVRCRSEAPALREIAPGRSAACHLNDGR
jgi:peptide/nickel transport system ATP-binding protein